MSSFVPLEQSYFNTPNIAGALAIADAGVAEDSDEMRKKLRENVSRHISLKRE